MQITLASISAERISRPKELGHLTEFRTCFTHMVRVFLCRKTGDKASLSFSDDSGFAAALSNLATRDGNGTSKHSDNSLT
jgi:hypothetical protein